MGAPIQGILFIVFQSIFQVFLLCLAGFTLSFKGIVDKPTSKVLNHINIALFTPALLFSKVAFFLTPAKLRQLWVIPIFFVVLTGLSAVIAHWLARACRLNRSQINFATAASMFMNSNSLPVALMQSLATTVPLLKWGPDDTIDAMFGRSLTYLVVFSTLGMILRWSYGIHLLSHSELLAATPPPTTYRDVDDTALNPSPLVDREAEPLRDRYVRRSRLRTDPRITLVSRRHTLPHPRGRLHSHLPAVPASLGDQSESEDTDELETTEGDSEDTIAPRSEQIDTRYSTEAEAEDQGPASEPPPRWDRRTTLFTRLLTTLASLSPPLVASLFALFCVLVPPAQRLLKSDEMIPFKGALDSAGACSVPLTMLVLGGWFWDGETKNKTSPAEDRAPRGAAKGKGVEKCHAPRPTRTLGPGADSRDSSTASLSSLIGAFGDVLMARIHPRRGAAQTRRRVRSSASTAGHRDVEPGVPSSSPLATHTETEIENAENGLGRASRSRPRADPANGHARPPAPPSPTSSTSPTSPLARGTHPGETLTVFITLLARMVLVPLVVTPMMVLVSRLGWGGDVFEDPVFMVSSMLLIASPPALSLAQISQRARTTKTPSGADTTPNANANENENVFSPFERLLSRTVFWAYLVLTPPITIASVMIGLVLIGA